MTRKPPLHVAEVLAWADAHHDRTGKWPETSSGEVVDAPKEKWANIDQALNKGLRGFRGGSSLAQLLAKHRGKRNRKRLPPCSVTTILKWVDQHHRRMGKWPHSGSGDISDAPGETWMAVEMALRMGQRGLPGGSGLATLLADRRRVRNLANTPQLTVKQVLAWADAHRRRTKRWPTAGSGRVVGARGETWLAIDQALKKQCRGLRVRSSLARVLDKYRRAGRR